jgi:beta-aspartyl-peptidase (threonine type)
MNTNAIILANAEIRDEIIIAGAEMLRRGANAADVAEQIARDVEDDPNEHTVGYSGYPNILGEVELDASFMDGATLKAGAVAALKGFRHPISVARQVMERLPHVLLVGDGAARFADEIGAERRDMLSDFAREAWQNRLKRLEIGDWRSGDGISNLQSLISSPGVDLIDLTNRALSYREGHDTMNVIVRDMTGNICTAVSTSGIAWKYPGRVGDSPVIGAGNYCDNRYGAAACMGVGEVAIRMSAAARVVLLMRSGLSLRDAGMEVVRDMQPIIGESTAKNHMQRADWVRILVMDAKGNTGGFATRPGLSYKIQTAGQTQPHACECIDPA